MKSKNKIQILSKFIWGIFIAVSFLSCENQLNTAPQDAYAEGNYWTNETKAKMALMGIYNGGNVGLNNLYDFLGYSGLLGLEVSTDNAFLTLGDVSDNHKLTSGNLLPGNGLVMGYWTASYAKILLCNNFLANIDKVPAESIKPESKTWMIAEARFIRAAEYFYLSQFYGAVPLVTKLLSVNEANTVPKTKQSDVEDFVTSELTAAAQDLPRFKDVPSTEKGRACKQAALAFLGRLQLAQKKYALAATTYKTIIDFGDNQIFNGAGVDSYEKLFNDFSNAKGGKFCSENIFSIQFVDQQSTNGNSIPTTYNPKILGGGVALNPFEDLAVEYDFKDGTPFSYSDSRYDPANLANQRDPRFAVTILYPNAMLGTKQYLPNPAGLAANVDNILTQYGVSTTGYSMRKYLPVNYTGNTAAYGANFPVIRYAEVLLSYLEAVMESNGAIDQTLLDNTINLIRGRTGVNMPKITQTGKDALKPILRKERRIELALEGIRYLDLKRWGLMFEKFNNKHYWGAPFPGATNLNNKLGLPNPNSLWYVCLKNIQQGQEMWPIPQTEQDINPNLR
jgi:starch-binding outer membrane protein, SusD/RagB family